jgi:DNA-binding MarR family transcriptional regulator
VRHGKALAADEEPRDACGESEREVLVSLTPDGQRVFEDIYPRHFEFLKDYFDSRLSRDEQAELTSLLQKLAE